MHKVTDSCPSAGMGFLLRLFCFLIVARRSAGSDLVCPRKELPPGVVVVSPGSGVLLNCSGDVMVDGVKVNFTRIRPHSHKKDLLLDTNSNIPAGLDHRDKNSFKSIAEEGLFSNSTERTNDLQHSDNKYTTAPPLVQSTDRTLKVESDQSSEQMDIKVEEGKEGNTVNRSIHSIPLWEWKKKPLWKENNPRRGLSFENTLSLESVGPTDSGKYTCLHRDTEEFSVKLFITDPPERPTLVCYKKSPSSKIHCESTPLRPIVTPPSCYLLLKKGFSDITHFPCSYSSQRSRCWCAMDFNHSESRTPHCVFLCATSFAGNATSDRLTFIPWDILKPDPPSKVLVLQEEGHPTRIKVRWNLPTSWKQQDHHSLLKYEIRYHPRMSDHEQATDTSDRLRHYINVLPDIEYVIQLRAQEEYEGDWSEWSSPVYGRGWTAVPDDQTTPVFDIANYPEGSGDDEPVDVSPDVQQRPHPILWITAPFGLLLLILVICIYRHKDRLFKVYSPNVIIQRDVSSASPLSAQQPAEGQALVSFTPMCFKQQTPNNCEEREGIEDEWTAQERMDAIHFDNASYFFLQSK